MLMLLKLLIQVLEFTPLEFETLKREKPFFTAKNWNLLRWSLKRWCCGC